MSKKAHSGRTLTISADDTTLAGMYGERFERDLLWMILFDKEFAQRAGRLAADPALFQDGTATHAVAEAYAGLWDTVSAGGHAPTFKAVRATVHENITRSKEGSPRHNAAVRAYLLLQRFAKQPAPDPADSAFMLEKAGQFITRLRVRKALTDSAGMWQRGEYSEIKELVDEAIDGSARAVAPDTGIDALDIAAKISRYSKRKKSLKHFPLDIPLWDNMLRGGLEPGTLCVPMGPAGRGKTLFLIHAGAVALSLGFNILHITCELSKEEVETRYDAHFTGVPINNLVENPLKYVLKTKRATRQLNKMNANFRIKYWGSDEASVTDVRALISTIQAQHGWSPDVVLVDYMDLLRPYRVQSQLRFELGDTARALRQLGADFQCAVISPTQTGKESFRNASMTLADVFESTAKVQIADVVVGLCQTEEERERDTMRLINLKNRLGGKEGSMVYCKIATETQTLTQSVSHPTLKRAFRR